MLYHSKDTCQMHLVCDFRMRMAVQNGRFARQDTPFIIKQQLEYFSRINRKYYIDRIQQKRN
ncbi:hypothetical protein M441DRAFT_303321, partial [Trichoderma asperellum CBS 433.97]